MRRLLAIAAGLAGLAAMAQAASGVALLEDGTEAFRRNGTAAPLFSFASPTAFRGYAAYAGLPAADGCYAAASVTGTKGEALTFTRATTRFCPTDGTTNEATGVMCSSGQVCISTLNGKRGISVFRAGTNLALRSQEFDNAAWTKISGGGPVAPSVDGTDSATCGNAPDGTQTAELVTWPIVNGALKYSLVRQVVAGTTAGKHCVWVKRISGGTDLWVNDGNGTAGPSTNCSPGASWSRCCVSTLATAGTVNIDIGASSFQPPQGSTPMVAGITACVWGEQTEASPYATPYVATTSAAVTRNAEMATLVPSAGITMVSPFSLSVGLVGPTANIESFEMPVSLYTAGAAFQWYLNETGSPVSFRGNSSVGAHSVACPAGAFDGDDRFAGYSTGSVIACCLNGTCGSTAALGSPSADAIVLLSLGYGVTWGQYRQDGLVSDVCLDSDPTRCR